MFLRLRPFSRSIVGKESTEERPGGSGECRKETRQGPVESLGVENREPTGQLVRETGKSLELG